MTTRRDDDIVKSTINEYRNVHIRTHVDELIAAVRKGFVAGCFSFLFKTHTHTLRHYKDKDNRTRLANSAGHTA